jgi:ISXO2 transposase-like protein
MTPTLTLGLAMVAQCSAISRCMQSSNLILADSACHAVDVQNGGHVLEKVTSQAMLDFVNEAISSKVSLLATDTWPGYSDYLDKHPHGSIDHHKKQYVVGAIHTNTIEGFWSIFKRGVVGTFHKVSAKCMPLYVAEFRFRYNKGASR